MAAVRADEPAALCEVRNVPRLAPVIEPGGQQLLIHDERKLARKSALFLDAEQAIMFAGIAAAT